MPRGALRQADIHCVRGACLQQVHVHVPFNSINEPRRIHSSVVRLLFNCILRIHLSRQPSYHHDEANAKLPD
jgi:hypothetical protein